jgi:hypothetical protein
MFSACQWEAPEARVVKISAIWTAVDASAAEAPSVKSKVELSNPNPIPSAPSTNWAIEPANAKSKRLTFTRSLRKYLGLQDYFIL